MTMVTSVATSAGTVTAEDRLRVDMLVRSGEAETIPAYAAPRGAALLLLGLAALLSAEPDGDEPIEDAHGGVVQDLSCAHAF